MKDYNVVLITVDCLRYDRCGFSGYTPSVTPYLDSFAGESIVYDAAYAPGPMTTESIPGILSGLHSYNSAQINDDIALKSLPNGQSTIASWLNNIGYSTSAVLSNSHLTSERNYDNGFDVFINPTDSSDNENDIDQGGKSPVEQLIGYCRKKVKDSDSLLSSYTPAYILYRYYQSKNEWPTPTAGEIVSETKSVVTSSSAPFFTWSHFMDVHAPFHPDTFQGISGHKGWIADCGWTSNIWTRWSDEVYDNALSYVDEHIKKLIRFIKRNMDWQNTMVIITADHGEALSDRGWIGHTARQYLFNELIHVPLLINHPDYESRKISDPVSLAWLSEIIAESLQVQKPGFPAEGGQSTYFRNTDDDSVVLADGIDEQGHTVAAINTSGKYIANSQWGEPKDYRGPLPHRDNTYYDLQSDPAEQDPLSEEHAPKELREKAHEKLSTSQTVKSLDGELSDGAKERLRDIGYLS